MRYLISLTPFLCLLCSCGGPGPNSTAWQAVDAESRALVEAMYDKRCATCHNDNGDGKGPSGMALHMPDFSQSTWMVGTKDEAITAAILDGTPKGMPGHPMLKDDPQLGNLLVYLKAFSD